MNHFKTVSPLTSATRDADRVGVVRNKAAKDSIADLTPDQLFDVLLRVQGAAAYAKPSKEFTTEDRIHLFQIIAADSMRGIMRTKGKRWKCCKVLLIEFADHFIQHVELQRHDLDDIQDEETFRRFAQSKLRLDYWRAEIDMMQELSRLAGDKVTPWRSAVALYAARFENGMVVEATDQVYPYKRPVFNPWFEAFVLEHGIDAEAR